MSESVLSLLNDMSEEEMKLKQLNIQDKESEHSDNKDYGDIYLYKGKRIIHCSLLN
jgi:hypothetical protein